MGKPQGLSKGKTDGGTEAGEGVKAEGEGIGTEVEVGSDEATLEDRRLGDRVSEGFSTRVRTEETRSFSNSRQSSFSERNSESPR